MIIQTKDLEFIKKIFQIHLPGASIYLFGSRVSGKAKRYSDLDVGLQLSPQSNPSAIEIVRENFAQSDLLFLVDIVNMAEVDDDFKRIIIKNGVKII